MNTRLFWKLLIGFWLTLLAIIEGLWVFIVVMDVPPRRENELLAQQVAPAELATLSTLFTLQGREGVEAVVARWPAGERARLSLHPADAPPPAAGILSTVAETADGRRLRLDYDPSRVTWERPGPLDIPWPLLVFGLIGGLIFSTAMAVYITRPIIGLRQGFARLAGGDLGVRLGGRLDRRWRDEIADLALHFDTMAERLQALVSQRDQLLNDVSHELRSPLARLQVSIGLARQSPARFDTALTRIEDEARRIDAMVGELLSLARAEAGTTPADEYFDLIGLLQAVVEDARFEAAPSAVAIPFHYETDESLIAGDAELLRRAFENILRNALRHAPQGSTVDVTLRDAGARDAGGRVEVVIADQGKGVPEEVLARMFEPFVRANGSSPGGFGLGLAIARRAVLSHGGTVTATNRPGGGFSVTVDLPTAAQAVMDDEGLAPR